ncbi:hypothetical protein BAUCODRAFT_377890 [Baudoinia panamericana UAMH 10762]|uniref:Uncharacterized protein n=1 Tax=Baudoinia panamericana (strain UAMH 10762) TaxID=717646 RepID=M2N3X7_BAUPA|nr:uncharacterized protein BAUCODRAFT_377890 [Baudoinia panamericana UAMH 10762]EMC98688.1 hypothetical protein BAUCODRAFT_377890 [Baudoinia panamericana UAMH 10762]
MSSAPAKCQHTVRWRLHAETPGNVPCICEALLRCSSAASRFKLADSSNAERQQLLDFANHRNTLLGERRRGCCQRCIVGPGCWKQPPAFNASSLAYL